MDAKTTIIEIGIEVVTIVEQGLCVTTINGGRLDGDCFTCSDSEDGESQHEKACLLVRMSGWGKFGKPAHRQRYFEERQKRKWR